MLVFCDESWKANRDGKMVGTLAAIAIPQDVYNSLADRLFLLAEKYWGFENAREREIKGKQLLCTYEYRREAAGKISMKLSYVREILEELTVRPVRIFASVVSTEHEVELLCAEGIMERPYVFLMERIHEYLVECGGGRQAILIFDDRGIGQNTVVGDAYRNFLTRSKTGRSFHTLLRSPMFAYSKCSTGIQIADIICTVVNRFHTCRDASPRIQQFYNLAHKIEWRSQQPDENGFVHYGIKVVK